MQDGVVAILRRRRHRSRTPPPSCTTTTLDRLPVVDDDGHLVGIVARGDILRAIVADLDRVETRPSGRAAEDDEQA